jgi:ribosome-associated heat shock protein Hsp15
VDEDRQRIDRWLWHARVVRTRSAAAALAASGHVRVNGVRIDAPSRPVKPGDVLTVALDRSVRILKVTGFAARRGSATDARDLFADITPGAGANQTTAAEQESAARSPGAGRPTKQARRAIARFTIRGDT